jgi:hypothetical protein
MPRLLNSLVWLACCGTPLFIAFFVMFRKRQQWRARRQHPFREFKRRPAGESLRLKLIELDDKLVDRLILFISVPAMLWTIGPILPKAGWVLLVLAVLISSPWVAVFGRKIYRLDRERSDYQLGFDGERFVGEALTPLVAQGFEIYHDVPFEGFNIDHVLVGPPGVFAVETKTRRKPVDETGAKEYRVEFDGTKLQWPWGPEAHDVEQAVNNARSLAQWLGGAVGESIYVASILTLPGWLVDRTAPPTRVHVVNPKEIIKVCGSKQAELGDILIRRICHQLDQKCRITID